MMFLFLFSSLALAGLVAADLPCTTLVNGSLAIQADTNDTLPQSMLSVGPWNGIYYPLQYIGGNETFTFQNCSSTFIGIGPSSDPGEDFYYGIITPEGDPANCLTSDPLDGYPADTQPIWLSACDSLGQAFHSWQLLWIDYTFPNMFLTFVGSMDDPMNYWPGLLGNNATNTYNQTTNYSFLLIPTL